MSISVSFLRPLGQNLGKLGYDPGGFLREAGVEPRASPDDYVSNGRVESALALAQQRTGEPALGLRLAAVSSIGSLGTFDYAVWSSTTLRDALERTARIYEYICRGVTLDGEVRDGHYHMRVRTRPGQPPAVVLVDFTFGIHVSRIREVIGDPRLVSVSFRHGGPEPRPYEDFFRVRVGFGQPADELVLDASVLDQPLRTADARTSAVLEAHALETIARLRPVDPFLDRLRAAVTRHLRSNDLELSSLAKELGLSTRTLQRHLQERGTSHREVVDGVRRELAMGMLADDKTSTVAVAYELGFASPQAFHRAFGRWTGMTPGQFRVAQRSAGHPRSVHGLQPGKLRLT